MTKKDLVSLEDYSAEDILTILKAAGDLKKNRSLHHDLLKGKSLGLVFQKPSNRTRVSFEVGITQLGGHCIYLGPHEINLGVRETTEDVAKTLSRYLDGFVARTHLHNDILDLKRHARVPVINGLSDLYHPCQTLTDLFSVQEHFGQLEGLTLAYVGDGNNVCHSLMLGCAKTGMRMNIATPAGYEPDPEVVALARQSSREDHINLSNDPRLAVSNAHVIYTDVWVSMGQESETHRRLSDFDDFQINNDLTASADPNYIFMHCLPAHRGQEVTEDIIDGKHSIVFDQAENRLHTQKAVLKFIYS